MREVEMDEEMYLIGEAARLLNLHAPTARRWLDGYYSRQRKATYAPVIREEHTGDDIVTWGEFVELGYLREYRSANVPLQELRPVIDWLRPEYGKYPLATSRPMIGPDRRLMVALQEKLGVNPKLFMVLTTGGGQLVLAPGAEAFFEKVEFTPKTLVAAWMHPVSSRSAVVIDPDVSFGAPTIHGIRTEILTELYEADELPERIASSYDMPVDDVHAAIRWELSLRRMPAAAAA